MPGLAPGSTMFLVAALRAILAGAERGHGTLTPVFDQVDWEGAGVSRSDVLKWFQEHRGMDVRGLVREARSRRMAHQAVTARERLTGR